MIKLEKEKTENKTRSNVLTAKISGEPELVYKFLAKTSETFPAESMYVSQLLKNKGEPGYHLFLKITFPPSNRTEAEEHEL